MAKTTIMSVWDKLMSEGSDACKADASKYINECAATALSDIMSEEDLPVVDDIEGDVTPEDGQEVVTVYYQDPEGSCDYDDDIIAASGKDDLDAAGWGKGLRVLNFVYDSSEDADQAAAQLSDIDGVPGLVVSNTVGGDSDDVSVEEIPVEEEENGEKNTLTVRFKSDGDDTAVKEITDAGIDVKSTEINDDGERVIVMGFDSEEVLEDAKGVVKDLLRGLGITDYSEDSNESEEEKIDEEETEETDDVIAPVDGAVDQTVDVAATINSIEDDIAALRAALEADGIDVGADSDDVSVASLEESFAGFEPVGKAPSCELNSKTGFGAEDGKSPVFTRPIKDRKPDGEPIEVKSTSTGDGTKLEASPSVKELPATKNVIKKDTQNYSKVSKETSSKLNSKEGFGEEGKDSVID